MVGEPTINQAKRLHKARYSTIPVVKMKGPRYTLRKGQTDIPTP